MDSNEKLLNELVQTIKELVQTIKLMNMQQNQMAEHIHKILLKVNE